LRVGEILGRGAAELRGLANDLAKGEDFIMRVIIRWVHIICAIPITGYIYSPFEVLPDYAAQTRYIFFPVMLLSGLWMWKGHLVRRMMARQA
jgi:hypothetical protein